MGTHISTKLNNSHFDGLLLLVVVFQFAVFPLTLFDVPIARQVVLFVYLTFVPGIVVLKLLRLNNLEPGEKAVFSVGFSVALVMVIGLLTNQFLFFLNVPNPLSSIPLLSALSIFVVAGAILVSLRNGNLSQISFRIPQPIIQIMILTCLPALSIVGTILVNLYEENMILLLMLLMIPVLFSAAVMSKKLFPPKMYSYALLMVGISLLFHYSLISSYVLGSDVQIEYYVFNLTKQSLHWNPAVSYFSDPGYGRLDSMLSVTILPTFYSNVLNLDPTWVLKIIFPIIFAFVTVGLYQFWKNYIGEKLAFLAAFLFMAEATFYTEMLQLARQMIGELFFALMLLTALSTSIKARTKAVTLMIFSFALIVSHYALAEILLFFVFSTVAILLVLKRPSKNLSVRVVAFLCVMMFLWYIYTANSSVFDSFVSFGNNIYQQLGDFFNPTSRGQTVLRGLGLESSPSILNTISRVFAYLTEGLIIAGFVALISRRARIRIVREHFWLTSTAMAILFAIILVPGLASSFNISRFYHILLFFLAPLCVLGADTVAYILTKRVAPIRTDAIISILLLVVLIPYFLFQTGFVYEVAQTQSYSIPLSSYRMGLFTYTYGLASRYDVVSSAWLFRAVQQNPVHIYCDLTSLLNTLTSYGMIYRGEMESLSNLTQPVPSSFIYLSHVNVVNNVLAREDVWNTSKILDNGKLNVLYNNGASEIMQALP